MQQQYVNANTHAELYRTLDGGLQGLVYSLSELFHLYLAMRVSADAHIHTGEER